jgi:hypothetical protein
MSNDNECNCEQALELKKKLSIVAASRKRWRTYGQAADEELARVKQELEDSKQDWKRHGWSWSLSPSRLNRMAQESSERAEKAEARVRELEAERVQLHDSMLALLGVVDEALEDLGGLVDKELRIVARARAMLADDAARERECR